MLSRRNSHALPTAPLPGTHTRRNSIMAAAVVTPPRGKKRASIVSTGDGTTLPLLDTHAPRAETAPMGSAHTNAWPSPRHDVDEAHKGGILSLEKSLELLDKILVDGAVAPVLRPSAPSTVALAAPPLTMSRKDLPAPSPTRRGSSYITVTNPQREDLYDTINMLKQELANERTARRQEARGGDSAALSGCHEAGDDYFTALGRNAELHVRAKKLESVANAMKQDLEASKTDQKRALDTVNLREEKLRNLIKKNKCLMTEYEVLKDQYVETKVKSVEVYRTMQLEQKKMELAQHEMIQEKLHLQHEVTVVRAELKELQKTSNAEKVALQSALTEAQTERDRLVLCLAETRHHFKQWKDRENKLVAAARLETREQSQAETAIRVGRCHDEIRLLRDKVAQLEQTNQLLRKEPSLSPLELAHRKQQLHADMTSQHADLIALGSRVKELEQMLALAKTQQEHQGGMLTAAQEAVSQILHAREVHALEQLTYTSANSVPRTLKQANEAPVEEPTSPSECSVVPVEKPRAPPATAPSPRVQTQRRKGTYKEVSTKARPAPPSFSPLSQQLETNLTVASWKHEVRQLTDQVDEYKGMVVTLTHEIEKLKIERKRLSTQKESDTERKYELLLQNARQQLAASQANEARLEMLIASAKFDRETSSARVIQKHLRVRMAQATLKAKLRATRAIQAAFKGYAQRKTTDLTKTSIAVERDVLQAADLPVESDDDADVYVKILESPPCVKVQVWCDGVAHVKYLPVRVLDKYVGHGVALAYRDPERLKKVLAALVSLVPNADDGVQIAIRERPLTRGQPVEHVEAITKIQSRAKGFLARKSLIATLENQIGAVRLIQAYARRYVAQRRYRMQLEALAQIQAVARGFAARRSVRAQKIAAIAIQAQAKAMLTRLTYVKKQQSIVVLQAQAKGFIARKDLERKRSAAICIQSKTKSHLKKKEYQEGLARSRAAKTIQARTKGYLTRKSINTKHEAVQTIQSRVRGHLTRKAVRTKHASAVCIQARSRAYLASKAYSSTLLAVCKIQAGVKGFQSRQLLSFRPRPLHPTFMDDAQDEYRCTLVFMDEPVDFRIRCIEAPPCVKIEALFDGMVYSAFVTLQRVNRFVGCGVCIPVHS
ncbi:hypothetical protein ACHHYP_03154 [Achlya hypogyna]|uniref:Myosin-like protein n=1 Tax=Achlya hypogyna TaxID=1202772 RepID=A0A1V9Z4D4_ACHHY|nr:hypothetical protein ACHHYP_03154 [Achlya hypogyna]